MKGQISAGDENMWIDTQHVSYTLYKNDSLRKLDSTTEAKENCFKTVGINNLGDLKIRSEENLVLTVNDPGF